MDLVELLVSTPAGLGLLASLEREAADAGNEHWWARCMVPDHVNPTTVARAIAGIQDRSPDWILSRAVKAAIDVGGPWWGDAPDQMASAYRLGPSLRPLAVATAEHLGPALTEPLDRDRQQCWLFKRTDGLQGLGGPLGSRREPCMPWVTATFDGVWTITSPGPELGGPLLLTWDYDFKPITRWALVVDPTARVFEVNAPEDWQRLVERYPLARAHRPNSSWELPGFNQDDPTPLAGIPHQRAQRATMRYFVEPDWNAAAEDIDAVHLTWAGFLTGEGTAIDLAGGDVAMLRGWNSERTLWLNPVLSSPEPLPAMPLPADSEFDDWIVDARDDPERLAQDRAWFSHKLGR